MPDSELQLVQRLLGPQAKLVPCERGSKKPLQPYAEKPDHLFHSRAWLEFCRQDVNLAVLCGKRSGGLVGIDFDVDARGLEFDMANPELMDTLRVVGARGWKVFFFIDGDFPPSEKTPECEWRGDKNLCHIAGMHPSGVPYRITVNKPPMRVRFDEICWPEGWVVPGITRAREEALAALTNKFGPPYWGDKEGEPSFINERFWAGAYMAETLTVWCPEEACFYRYVDKDGVWVADDENVIKARLGGFLVDSSRSMNLPWLATQTSAVRINAIASHIKNEASKPGAFAVDRARENIVHAANTMLVWRGDDWVAEPFSPEFYSRNACAVAYDPAATCPRFLNELVLRCLSEDDANVLQMYGGMCLLGRNLLQRILIIDGAAGTGKSQIVDVLTRLLGLSNVVSFRAGQLDDRFETARFLGKSLLIGADVAANFLAEKGADMLKSLVGGDFVRVEVKGARGRQDIPGIFNVLITANAQLRVHLQGEGDAEAWRRRIAILRSEASKPEKVIPNFGQVLLREEGPGILNWFLDGARKLLAIIAKHGARLPLTEEQAKRVDRALSESDSLRLFLIDGVRFDSEEDLTTEEVLGAYAAWCQDEDIVPLAETVAQRQLPTLMMELFAQPKSNTILRNGRRARGFNQVALVRMQSSVGNTDSGEDARYGYDT